MVFTKNNSTVYKPYKFTGKQRYFNRIKQKQNVILDVFVCLYALKDVDISKISTVLVSYENNDLSMKASAKAVLGKQKISGKLPVIVNDQI